MASLVFLLGPSTELIVVQLSYKIRFLLHITIGSRNGLFSLHKEEKTTLQNDYFLICRQLMRHPLTEFFHFSKLLQILNDHRIVRVEFFAISCVGSTFNDSQLVVVNSDDQSLRSSPSRLLSPLQNFVIHHCTFLSSSWVRCIIDVVSCLHCFTF